MPPSVRALHAGEEGWGLGNERIEQRDAGGMARSFATSGSVAFSSATAAQPEERAVLSRDLPTAKSVFTRFADPVRPTAAVIHVVK